MSNPTPWKKPLFWMKGATVILIGIIVVNLWYQSKLSVRHTPMPDSAKDKSNGDQNLASDLVGLDLHSLKVLKAPFKTYQKNNEVTPKGQKIQQKNLSPVLFSQLQSSDLGKKLKDLNLISLWATWCPSCKQDFPELQKLHQKWQEQGFQVLSLNCDFKEDEKTALTMFQSYDLSFPVFFDPENLFVNELKLEVLPTYLLVKKSGKVLMRVDGSIDWQKTKIKEMIPAILNANVQ